MARDKNSAAAPAKTRRSRRGCLTCRQRKVKCDETRDVCRNCFRLDTRCTWETPGDSEPGRRRSRNWRACARCRDKKLRCTAPSSGSACGQCLRAGTACDAIASDPSIAASSAGETMVVAAAPPSIAFSSDASAIVPRHELLAILDFYFAGPHHFCYSTFLHRSSFMKMLENGLIPRSLLLVVLATGLQLMGKAGDVQRSARADAWVDESRSLVVLSVFERISTTNLQTLLLLQRYEWHRGAHLSAWFLTGLAYRLAHALQLHLEPTDVRAGGADQREREREKDRLRLPPSVVETRRRLIWSCFVMDSVPDAHQSGTRPLQKVLDPAVIHSRLPCDEAQYEEGSGDRDDAEGRESHSSRSSNSTPSMAACLIRMIILRQKILTYSWATKSAAAELAESNGDEDDDDGSSSKDPHVWPWHDGAEFHALQQQLDGLVAGLPPSFQLHRHASVPEHDRIAFYLLHTMFHAAYTDLLRIGTSVNRLVSLHKPTRSSKSRVRVPPDFVNICKVEQLKHACGIANVVTQCLQSLAATEHDPFIAICSCLAIRTIVVERLWNRDVADVAGSTEAVLSLNDARVKDGLAACLACAKRTARWSMPIRRLLLAVDDLTRQYGYPLDVAELRPSASPTSQQSPSRPGSPNLKLYGTQGSIQKARDEHDLEVVQAVEAVAGRVPTLTERNGESGILLHAPQPLPATAATAVAEVAAAAAAEAFTTPRTSLAPDALRIASNWADGTYDVPLAQTTFDWSSFELGLGLNPMDMDVGMPAVQGSLGPDLQFFFS
ncbi:Zinc cluster transcription factor czf1 [Sporothrix curviconia]|uniref:Zinc cluster transcription factor czf1 n=1 Tax=Sporothrix curviconia TaxID=1260050 RepID=A0ABP0C1Y9_9PEZI